MPARPREFDDKRKTLLEYMDRHGFDVIVLTRRANFAWATGGGLNHVGLAGEIGVSSLVVTFDRSFCVANNIESVRLRDEELGDLDLDWRVYDWYDSSSARRHWTATLSEGRVACDVRVPGMTEEVELLPADFAELRHVLPPPEQRRYESLGRDAAQCLEDTCRAAEPGMSEFALAGTLTGRLAECGIRTSVVLIAADERVHDYRHPIPTSKTFTRYGMAVAGAERDGLIVSCTRLFAFGPVDDDLRQRHEAVCKVDAAMITHTRPGRTLGEIFAITQQAYADTGYPNEWRLHHQGGPSGYLPREAKAAPDHSLIVRADQPFAWNPSIAGTKSEDTILVGDSENRIVTTTGRWPTIPVAVDGQTIERCAILEK